MPQWAIGSFIRTESSIGACDFLTNGFQALGLESMKGYVRSLGDVGLYCD